MTKLPPTTARYPTVPSPPVPTVTSTPPATTPTVDTVFTTKSAIALRSMLPISAEFEAASKWTKSSLYRSAPKRDLRSSSLMLLSSAGVTSFKISSNAFFDSSNRSHAAPVSINALSSNFA